jgi:dTDP-4-amino-4,6-dideoxygalactose transaminase
MNPIPFNKPYLVGMELDYIREAHANGHLSGNGPFAQKCQQWLEKNIGSPKTLLTHSGTAALEMAALLLNLQPGDEVIMPSYTFVSTANAFVLRGAVPVFVDIRRDTLNLDETLIEAAITPKTKAIVPVHYAGVGCEMETILKIADKHRLMVIEDAAHGIMASYKNKPLGRWGHLSAFSFHETKNIIAGEGGALAVNESQFLDRAEILWEKGTNRKKFLRGEVDKYTWVDVGSSFLPSELVAAFLFAQMEKAENITRRRLNIWNTYHQAFECLEKEGTIRRPVIPSDCDHNAHMYYLLLENNQKRNQFLEDLKQKYDIHAVFHYIPLHSSPAGLRYGRFHGNLNNTVDLSGRLIRLPLWIGLEDDQQRVIENIQKLLKT